MQLGVMLMPLILIFQLKWESDQKGRNYFLKEETKKKKQQALNGVNLY